MPNHVMTKIVANKNVLNKIKKIVKSEKQKFDFNNLIPMPKELDGTTSPVHIVTEEERRKQILDRNKSIEENGEDHWFHPNVHLTKELSDKYHRLYGYNNWYDWSINNWGTKWNAYSIDFTNEGIYFQTAWSVATPVLLKLSEKLGNISFLVEYANEDIGYNCGTMKFNNGEVVEDSPYSHSQGSIEFACELWDYDFQEYLNEMEE